MLEISFAVLLLAVALGTLLALLHLRPGRASPPWPFGALHGLIAAGGFGLLLGSLGGPPRGLINGTAEFGVFAAALFALALIAGLGLLALLRAGRRPGFLIAVHAALAITGFVLLAAYVFAG
ncbi:MAG: hypothetical protein ACRECE_13770 [Xanthobacteraceae bacterium]